MKIIDLQINHLTTPLGYELTDPRLSWRYDGLEKGDGTRVVQARVTVGKTREGLLAGSGDDLLFDTGWQTGLDPRATPLNLALDWRQRYWWRVQVRTDTGRMIASDPTWFETGVMEDEWISDWITTGEEDPQNSRHPIFSRRLELKQSTDNIERARVYACGLGLIRLFVGGKPIDAAHGQGRLDPGDFATDAWLQTMTYDITDALKAGTETGSSTDSHGSKGKTHATIAFLLGNGWYRGRVLTGPLEDPRERPWDLIAEVHIWYKNGMHQVIGTNAEWKVTRSHITNSSIYDGESRDDTLPDVEAVPSVANEHNHALLYDRMSPPVTVCAELPVVKDLTSPSGKRIFDLGQNFAGVFRFHNRLPRGAHLVFQFGEHLEAGEFDRRNLRTAKQRYDYVSDGKEKDIEPFFTYYGYRYVLVHAQSADGKDLTSSIRPDDFTGLALSSQMARIGNVHTGNARINRLIANAEWSRRSNFMDTPTDCPQRDERLGWTGDAQVFAPTALDLADATAFYTKYLFDMRAAQERNSGMVPVIIPAIGDQFSHVASAAWSDAAVILPWTLYRFTGDSNVLAHNYSLMKDWVTWIDRTDKAGNKPEGKAWRTHFHFGDWLALDGAPGAKGVRGATPVGLIADSYWYLSARLLAQTARILRNRNDANAFAAMAQRVRSRILHDYFDADGLCTASTQTAYILSLALGFGDRARTASALRKRFAADDGRLKTGFVGTSLLVSALATSGMTDVLLDLLLDRRYPGWLAAIDLGATTIWERWNSLLPDGRLRFDPSDPLGNMNSLNHYWLGSIVDWFFRFGAGFDQSADSAGFRHVRIAPHVSRRLGSLEMSYRAPAGVWHISWKIDDGTPSENVSSSTASSQSRKPAHIHVDVIVPFDASADLVLPCAGENKLHRLGPGRHIYDYDAAEPVPR